MRRSLGLSGPAGSTSVLLPREEEGTEKGGQEKNGEKLEGENEPSQELSRQTYDLICL